MRAKHWDQRSFGKRLGGNLRIGWSMISVWPIGRKVRFVTKRGVTRQDVPLSPLSPNRDSTRVALPFVARCGFGLRLFAVAIPLLILLLIFGAKGASGEPAVIQVWDQRGVVMKLGVLFMFVLIPALPIEVFRARTIFTEDEIQHLPTLGGWRTFLYQDIVDLKVFPNEFARLEFRDNRTLKIWAMRADPLTVERIIRRKWRPHRKR